MRILVIQHHSNSGIGHLVEPAAERGVEWSQVFPIERGDAIPAGPNSYDGLVIFGGTPHANDDAAYPHLKNITALIGAFHREAKPVLGICLGSQLIARAFGARVYKAPQSEIGFYRLKLCPEAKSDALLRDGVPDPVHLIEFHYDTFDLPKGATQLMAGADYAPIQAFRMGETTYAFQPHFEATPTQLHEWLVGARRWVEYEHPDVPAGINDELARHGPGAQEFARRVGGAWFDLVRARSPTL
ncbi:MAG: type 1 glutamine amidotransferase [Alphaproteobacteria bacterium]|nr:type 1 glutamine amidotransferase [Alphaproteobacteria bacterium]